MDNALNTNQLEDTLSPGLMQIASHFLELSTNTINPNETCIRIVSNLHGCSLNKIKKHLKTRDEFPNEDLR